MKQVEFPMSKLAGRTSVCSVLFSICFYLCQSSNKHWNETATEKSACSSDPLFGKQNNWQLVLESFSQPLIGRVKVRPGKTIGNYTAAEEEVLQLEDSLSDTPEATGKRFGYTSNTKSVFKFYVLHQEEQEVSPTTIKLSTKSHIRAFLVWRNAFPGRSWKILQTVPIYKLLSWRFHNSD